MMHCKLQRRDRIRISAVDATAAGLRGAYKRAPVQIPDLPTDQRVVRLGLGLRSSGYMVQAGWPAVMKELGWSEGMWVTLTIQAGRVRSIQKRARPADPAPSMSAALRSFDSLSTEGHMLEQEQQPPQPAAPELAAQAAALSSAAAPLGSMLFNVSGASSTKTAKRLPKRQAQAAFPGYSKKDSDVSVPALQRRFTVSMGWGGSEGRFVLGAGWTELVAAAGLRDGDCVRVSRTGVASFQLETGPDLADAAEEEAANESQGAHAEGLGGMPCCAVDGHASVRPGTLTRWCCPCSRHGNAVRASSQRSIAQQGIRFAGDMRPLQQLRGTATASSEQELARQRSANLAAMTASHGELRLRM